jgi:hypothetical protein
MLERPTGLLGLNVDQGPTVDLGAGFLEMIFLWIYVA